MYLSKRAESYSRPESRNPLKLPIAGASDYGFAVHSSRWAEMSHDGLIPLRRGIVFETWVHLCKRFGVYGRAPGQDGSSRLFTVASMLSNDGTRGFSLSLVEHPDAPLPTSSWNSRKFSATRASQDNDFKGRYFASSVLQARLFSTVTGGGNVASPSEPTTHHEMHGQQHVDGAGSETRVSLSVETQ